MIVDDYNVYKLSNIIRYSQQNKIKNETVAEHSYYVSWFVNRLCTKYSLSDTIRLMALEAALLHDVVEDTPITHEDIVREFGDEIAEMVEGVTKLRKN